MRTMIFLLSFIAIPSLQADEIQARTQWRETYQESLDLYRAGNIEKAAKLAEKALTIAEANPRYSDTAITANRLANYYLQQSRYQEAAQLYWKALHYLRSPQSPSRISYLKVFNNLIRVTEILQKQQRHDQSIRLWESLADRLSQDAREIDLNPKSTSYHLIKVLDNLARAHYFQGNFHQAELTYQQILSIYRRDFSPESLAVSEILDALGVLYRDWGHLKKAESYLKKSLAMKEKMLDPGDTHIAVSLEKLAELYWGIGRRTEAETLKRRAREIRDAAPDQPTMGMKINANPASVSILLAVVEPDQQAHEHEHADVEQGIDHIGELVHDGFIGSAFRDLSKHTISNRTM